jgi:hypothetical protein
MAAAPVYPSAPFVLVDTDTGVSASAEVTLAADCEITNITATAAGTTTLVLAVTDSGGSTYANVAFVNCGSAKTLNMGSESNGYSLVVAGASNDGTGVNVGGMIPRHLKSGCKIKATRGSENDAVSLHVSGLLF